MRKDPVTPEMREAVFARDRRIVAEAMSELGLSSIWREQGYMVAFQPSRTVVVCPAVVIDMGQFGLCWGRWTLDHIKRRMRLGKRAESTMNTLISLCEGHTEPGMKAGHVWNTANRPAIRRYLD